MLSTHMETESKIRVKELKQGGSKKIKIHHTCNLFQIADHMQ